MYIHVYPRAFRYCACAAVIVHVTCCLYSASCHSNSEAGPLGIMPETIAMEGDPRSLRVKIISMGAAECGKVSLCILCAHIINILESMLELHIVCMYTCSMHVHVFCRAASSSVSVKRDLCPNTWQHWVLTLVYPR